MRWVWNEERHMRSECNHYSEIGARSCGAVYGSYGACYMIYDGLNPDLMSPDLAAIPINLVSAPWLTILFWEKNQVRHFVQLIFELNWQEYYSPYQAILSRAPRTKNITSNHIKLCVQFDITCHNKKPFILSVQTACLYLLWNSSQSSNLPNVLYGPYRR